MINDWLNSAINKKACDIHIEKFELTGRVRFRIDGKLILIDEIRNEKYPAIISRLKIMANLDIGEKRRPQDGRIALSQW